MCWQFLRLDLSYTRSSVSPARELDVKKGEKAWPKVAKIKTQRKGVCPRNHNEKNERTKIGERTNTTTQPYKKNNLIKVYPACLHMGLTDFVFIFFGRSFDDRYLQTFTSRVNRDTGRDQEEHCVPSRSTRCTNKTATEATPTSSIGDSWTHLLVAWRVTRWW
jgi:hypothetical protein